MARLYMNEELHQFGLAWLEKASHDLETARRLTEGYMPITDVAVYHCQQAAEKSLKAMLVVRGLPVSKTHDLMALLSQCLEFVPDANHWIDAASILTPYATHYRYPTGDPDPDLAVTAEALKHATELYAYAASHLGVTPEGG